MVTVFKENLNFQLPLIFHISIRCVFETVFISEQIAENWSGALLEISDKSISSAFLILQFRLETVWKISKQYYLNLKTVARQFCLKGHRLYRKCQGLTQEIGKDVKIKHSVSSPSLRSMSNFFRKKSFAWENKLFWKNLWEDILHGD